MAAADVSTLIGISDDARQDTARKLVTARLLNLLGGIAEVPEELTYIIDEVCIARFNRIGSEGLAWHDVEGETQRWEEDLFAPYMTDIQAWRDRNNDQTAGKIRFL